MNIAVKTYKKKALHLYYEVLFGDPPGNRTPDNLIKSQVLYRLS